VIKRCFFLLFFIHHGYAETLIINGATKINTHIVYQNVILDMSNGYFIIAPDGYLEIKDSQIKGTMFPDNFYLFDIEGNLRFENNILHLNSENILPKPNNISNYFLFHVTRGIAKIVNNQFFMETPYTVGFFLTDEKYKTTHLFDHNLIFQFHGGIFLANSDNTIIKNNIFTKVSLSNILNIKCHNNVLEKNKILFSGYHTVGDAIDIFQSDTINIKNNFIASDYCYSIVISDSKNLLIDQNQILDGITYGISIEPFSNVYNRFGDLFNRWDVPYENINQNENIKIQNNYLAQNRYGLTATNVTGLTVVNNVFIQKFENTSDRKFWTNNEILLNNVTRLLWENNKYKEAFSQDISDSNKDAFQLVLFPSIGGVQL